MNPYAFTKKHYFQQRLVESNVTIPDTIIDLVSSEIKNSGLELSVYNIKQILRSNGQRKYYPHCQNILNQIMGLENKKLNEELQTRMLEQFSKFDIEYKKLADKFEITNLPSFDLIRDHLIKFNTNYSDFTIVPVKVTNIDIDKHHEILDRLELKLLWSCLYTKEEISNCLIYQVFENLGWIEFIFPSVKN